MYCPGCHSPMEKARLDVYWCKYCQTSWLVHKLSYKTKEEASEIGDGRPIRGLPIHPDMMDFRVPPKG